MRGHLFITQGDLTELACDAWALPTDAAGWLTSSWVEALPRLAPLVGHPSDHGWRQLQAHLRLGPGERVRRLALQDLEADEPEPWIVHTAHSDPDEVWASLVEFLERARPSQGESKFGRALPLLGVPLAGTGAGGGGRIKGEFIDRLVRNLHDAAGRLEIDVALVTRNEAERAAAVAARRRSTAPAWPTRDPALGPVLEDLAGHGSHRDLVLFLGAGVGRGAGLPLWTELLEHLESEAQLSLDQRKALPELDEPDRATLLDIGLERAGKRLGEVVARRLASPVVSLSHTLLATLPTAEAATTNYDDLYERACAAVGRPLAVLPDDRPSRYAGWVLKLHGTIGDPSSIVLTRGDYLAYLERRSALAGVVEALLLTRHMLFVGFSLQDETFQRIVHQVRNAVGRADRRPDPAPFGTAVLFGGAGIMNDLWRGDLRCVDVPDARGFELFLDALADRCTDTAAYLLSPGYEGALTEDEQLVRERVSALRDDPAVQSTAIGRRVLDLLVALDRERPPIATTAAPSTAPMVLRFSIGSGLGSWTELELRSDGLLHYELTGGDGRREASHTQPPERAWRRLRRTMERRGVREWQEDHQPNTVVHDGEAWSLDVAFADGVSCRSRGYAAYPPAGDLEPSQAFIAVLAALSEVAGGRDVGGVRAPLRPTPGQRIAAAQRVEALGQDIGRLEASLPAWRMLARRPGERSVNWMPSGDHGAWPELAALTTAPWPMWDARGMAPTVDGLGVVLVRTLGHPSELVADADGLDLGEQGLAGIIEKLAPSIGVQPTLAWLGTYSDVAVRFCAVVEARRLLGVPVRGVLLGVAGSQEDDSAVAWRAAFAHAWRALELDVLGHDGDALAYAVAEVP